MGLITLGKNYLHWTLAVVIAGLLVKTKNRIWRTFWAVLLVVTIIAFFLHCAFTVTEYLSFEKTTVIRLFAASSAPFPAVTICNLNPFKQSAINQSQTLSNLISAYKYTLSKKEAGQTSASTNVRKKRAPCEFEGQASVKAPSQSNFQDYTIQGYGCRTTYNITYGLCGNPSLTITLVNVSSTNFSNYKTEIEKGVYLCFHDQFCDKTCNAWESGLDALTSFTECAQANFNYPPETDGFNFMAIIAQSYSKYCNLDDKACELGLYKKPSTTYPGIYWYNNCYGGKDQYTGQYDYEIFNITMQGCDENVFYNFETQIMANCTGYVKRISDAFSQTLDETDCGTTCGKICPYRSYPYGFDICFVDKDQLCQFYVFCNSTSTTKSTTTRSTTKLLTTVKESTTSKPITSTTMSSTATIKNGTTVLETTEIPTTSTTDPTTSTETTNTSETSTYYFSTSPTTSEDLTETSTATTEFSTTTNETTSLEPISTSQPLTTTSEAKTTSPFFPITSSTLIQTSTEPSIPPSTSSTSTTLTTLFTTLSTTETLTTLTSTSSLSTSQQPMTSQSPSSSSSSVTSTVSQSNSPVTSETFSKSSTKINQDGTIISTTLPSSTLQSITSTSSYAPTSTSMSPTIPPTSPTSTFLSSIISTTNIPSTITSTTLVVSTESSIVASTGITKNNSAAPHSSLNPTSVSDLPYTTTTNLPTIAKENSATTEGKTTIQINQESTTQFIQSDETTFTPSINEETTTPLDAINSSTSNPLSPTSTTPFFTTTNTNEVSTSVASFSSTEMDETTKNVENFLNSTTSQSSTFRSATSPPPFSTTQITTKHSKPTSSKATVPKTSPKITSKSLPTHTTLTTAKTMPTSTKIPKTTNTSHKTTKKNATNITKSTTKNIPISSATSTKTISTSTKKSITKITTKLSTSSAMSSTNNPFLNFSSTATTLSMTKENSFSITSKLSSSTTPALTTTQLQSTTNPTSQQSTQSTSQNNFLLTTTSAKPISVTQTQQLASQTTSPKDFLSTTKPSENYLEALSKAYKLNASQSKITIETNAQQSLITIAASLSDEEKEALGYKIGDLIQTCIINGVPCNIERDFTQIYDVDYGFCYTFNYELFYNTTQMGSNYGLKMVVLSDVNEYIATSSEQGIKVVVHYQEQSPFPNVDGYRSSVGKQIDLRVTYGVVRRLDAPYGTCNNLDKLKELNQPFYFEGMYTVEGCYRSCFQQKISIACGCSDPRFPLPADLTTSFCKILDTEKYACYEQYIVDNGDYYNVDDCSCAIPCDETTYDSAVYYANWPYGTFFYQALCTNSTIMNGTDCQKYYRDNGVLVQVSYARLGYESIEEEPVHSAFDLFNDLAGNTGLWIGFSALTITELALIFIQFCLWVCTPFELKEVPSCRVRNYPEPEDSKEETDSTAAIMGGVTDKVLGGLASPFQNGINRMDKSRHLFKPKDFPNDLRRRHHGVLASDPSSAFEPIKPVNQIDEYDSHLIIPTPVQSIVNQSTSHL